jgi:prophage maintenance system killer protein
MEKALKFLADGSVPPLFRICVFHYLLEYIHPFYDGNKRIGALLCIVFLTINDQHLAKNGDTKISDRALTAIALLIAESNPNEKPLIIALVVKLLES